MVIVPFVRMGPLPRSLAAERMIASWSGSVSGPTEYKYAAQENAPYGRLPSARLLLPKKQRPPTASVAHRDQAAIRHHHQPADRNPECHGAHSREGPLLAIPAMLALKCALRLAAGGFPTPPLRSVAGALPGRDGKRSQK
jgi:hypothetical protein